MEIEARMCCVLTAKIARAAAKIQYHWEVFGDDMFFDGCFAIGAFRAKVHRCEEFASIGSTKLYLNLNSNSCPSQLVKNPPLGR